MSDLTTGDNPSLLGRAGEGTSNSADACSRRGRPPRRLRLLAFALAALSVESATTAQTPAHSEPGLVIRLVSPAPDSTLSNLYNSSPAGVPIIGTAAGTTLDRWTLEVASAPALTSWTTLVSGTGSVTEGLLATWSTSTIPNGRYALRLRGTATTEATSAATTEVNVANISVTASARQLDVGAGGIVSLTTVLPMAARERLEIRDTAGAVVRTLVDAFRPAGLYVDAWDGKGQDAERVKDSQYRWVALFEVGEKALAIDLTSEMDGDAEVKSHPEYEDWRPFDNEPLKVRVTFDRPGEVVLIFSHYTYYVTPRCTPPDFFCRFLDGWDPAGEFLYEWAGVDDSGALRNDLHGVLVISHHEDLSRNGVVVFGGRPKISGVKVTPALYSPDRGTQELTFSLTTYRNEPVSAVVTWTSQSNLSVLRRLVLPSVLPGLVKTTWDGRADNRMHVAPGRYTVAVVVTDSLGQSSRGEILTRVEY